MRPVDIRPNHGQPLRRARPITCLVAALILCLAGASRDAAAQQADSVAAPQAVFTGRVIEGFEGNPVPTAYIQVTGTKHYAVSGADGSFQLRLPPGNYSFSVRLLGYADLYQTIYLSPGTLVHEFVLAPRPVLLQAIEVVTDHLRARRNAIGVSVRVLDRRILLDAAGSATDVVLLRSGIREVECPLSDTTSMVRCAWIRGEAVPVSVAIDDRPAFGGLDELDSYQPHELYLIEVYASGRHIRAYTNRYIARTGERIRTDRSPLPPLW